MQRPWTLRSLPLAASLLLLVSLPACTTPTLTPTPDAPATQAALAAAVDATLTAKPPVPTDTPYPTYTPLPTYTPPPTSTPEPTATPAPTNTPMPTPRPTVPTPTATPALAIAIRIVKHSYNRWGRPAGMDNPGLDCGPFDDKRPVTMMAASLVVENKSDKNMEDWYGHFFGASGKELYTCYYVFTKSGFFPVLKPGESVEVTFAVFSEEGNVDIYGYVEDEALGRSNQVTFPLK